MQKRTLKILTWSISSIILCLGAYLFTNWVFHRFDLPNGGSLFLNAASTMKELNETNLAQYNPKSQRSIDVLHYNINIDLHPEQKKIFGDVTITMKINDKQADKIDINFYDNLKINELQLNGTKAEFDRSEKIISVKRNNKLSDTANIRIVYEGTPKSLGFGSFNFNEVKGKPAIYTLSEPVFASTWFPCVDLPDDKALADIFVTNDSSNVSLSNGKLIEVKSIRDRKTYHWKTFYPISTYLISIYSARYKSFSQKYLSVSGDTLNLVYYTLPENLENARRDFSDHPNYLRKFEEIFGPYPFVKEKYSVAEFWWQVGAMENQTITGIGSNFIGGRKFFSDMLVHELSHHWWGDAVGPKTWKDIWLNEGFATYSEALYWEKQAGFSALQSTMQSKFGMFPIGKLYNPGNALFSSLVYDKGCWVLHMLRKEVGDQNFFKIMKEYFNQYKYGNASTSDFKSLCEKISNKNLSQFFEQWVFKGEGIIELGYEWATVESGSEFKTTIKIKQLQNGYDIYKFPIDIKLIFENGTDSQLSTVYISTKETEVNLSSKKKPVNIELDPDKWLLAKINSLTKN